VEEVIEHFHEGKLSQQPKDELNMDNYEWTTYCHGASLSALAGWRKDAGKSNVTSGSKIDYKKFGWTIRNDKLIGLNCCDGF
jgi:hypothetical protein